MKTISILFITILLACTAAKAQDTLYIYNSGKVVNKFAVAEIDSVIFYKPNNNTLTDADGNVYHTVTIGTQTWMVENLRTTKFNDNTDIPNITDRTVWTNLITPAYCWYDNNTANKPTYGALYNWYTVNTGKLAPNGWHIPTDDEWTTLENYLIANGYNYDGTTVDNKYAKALASVAGWDLISVDGAVGNTDYPSKRNTTGFTALPGGFRGLYGYFYDAGGYGDWWSSSEDVNAYIWSRYIQYYISFVGRGYSGKSSGLSVRCIRND